MFNLNKRVNNFVNYDNISMKFLGNFYINFDEVYYIFEGLGYKGLKNNVDLNEHKFLLESKAKLYIYNEKENKIVDTKDFDLSKLKNNFVSTFIDYGIFQNFKLIIEVFYKDEKIYNNEFSFNKLIKNYQDLYKDKIDISISRIIPIVTDLNQNIDFNKIFCLNCTNEDLRNIYKELSNDDFYVIHKMNKLLNFKFIDYKIYSKFLKDKKYKHNDIIIYQSKYDNLKQYYFNYKILDFNKKNYLSNFFYKLKDILSQLNYNSITSKDNVIYDIFNNKRKIILYVQEFKKIQSKDFFQFVIQQNLKNII